MTALINPIRTTAWWAVNRWIEQTFPGLPTLTTQRLADWLSQGQEPLPILLDVRRDYEFAVSHLPQAHLTPNLDAALALGIACHQPIVAYCSVGYRSGRLVGQLREAGYTQVYNLSGSAFRWANEGRSLVSDGQPVEAVHPFNPLWGLLLKPGLGHRLEE
ncbi:rhodanese-like domain-containing protein [Nodosilinea sp. LEGE 07088]|uniref:rhodanese-like domain-containing protein n=1 Tax=Nodosilinea sp. LEGE 07088 TaxID=2777968 RepID=UPI00188118D1|nr:rhodanese-like domain-containing protein [Nodosilinea sp. LEGE 07088]MBE9138084.1 rhodanese-like domain-containing protein [Nodosilinea sp. LEGE 07088]